MEQGLGGEGQIWRVYWGWEFSSCLFSALLCPLLP